MRTELNAPHDVCMLMRCVQALTVGRDYAERMVEELQFHHGPIMRRRWQALEMWGL